MGRGEVRAGRAAAGGVGEGEGGRFLDLMRRFETLSAGFRFGATRQETGVSSSSESSEGAAPVSESGEARPCDCGSVGAPAVAEQSKGAADAILEPTLGDENVRIVCCDCFVAVCSVCAAGCVPVAFDVPVAVSWVAEAKGARERLGGDVELRGLAPTVFLTLAVRRD